MRAIEGAGIRREGLGGMGCVTVCHGCVMVGVTLYPPPPYLMPPAFFSLPFCCFALLLIHPLLLLGTPLLWRSFAALSDGQFVFCSPSLFVLM